jgi:hypothetical protein
VQHGGESLADVLAGQREVGLLQRVSLRRVGVDRARERGLEPREVRAALVRIDVVDERKNVLVVAVVVLERELDADVVLLDVEIEDLGMEALLAADQERDELLEPALRVEGLGALNTKDGGCINGRRRLR